MPTFHVYPVVDEREHELSPDCWCRPVPDEEEESVWIHNDSSGESAALGPALFELETLH